MKPIDRFFRYPVIALLCMIVTFLFPHVKLHNIFAVSPSILISEIQISGATPDDEFVELYNPMTFPVDLAGWRLARKTSATSSGLLNLVSSMSGILQAHRYLLIANPDFRNTSTNVDLWYTASTSAIAANNTVILFSDAGSTIIDKVGLGTANDKEGTTTSNPGTGQSVERKANSLATNTSMQIGGGDELSGNGFDTDDNQADFIVRSVPQPQNLTSPEEPSSIPSTTPSITPTLTNTPTITQPTISHTHSPSPTITLPTTPTITPIPTPPNYPFPTIIFSCSTTLKYIKTPWKTFSFPILSCRLRSRL